MRTLLFIAACFMVSGAAQADEIGEKIARDSDALARGYVDMSSNISMTTTESGGLVSTYEISVIAKEHPDGNKSIMSFLKPADQKGTMLMVHGKKNQADDQWIFLPSQKRTKKISGSLKQSAFLGSEFTFEDMSDAAVDDYINDYGGDHVIDGLDCYAIIKKPIDKNSSYSKLIVYLDKQHLRGMKVEYFNQRDERFKELTFENHSIGSDGRWRPEISTMTNLSSGKKTVFKTLSYVVGTGVSDSQFSMSRFSSN